MADACFTGQLLRPNVSLLGLRRRTRLIHFICDFQWLADTSVLCSGRNVKPDKVWPFERPRLTLVEKSPMLFVHHEATWSVDPTGVPHQLAQPKRWPATGFNIRAWEVFRYCTLE